MFGDYTIGGTIFVDTPGFISEEWEMEMRAYDGDLSRVWLDCIVPICSQKYYKSYFTHGLISAYGIVSSDKKTITIPVPQETSAWLSDLFAKYKDDDYYWVYKLDNTTGDFITTPGNIVFTKQADGTYKAADFDYFGVTSYGETGEGCSTFSVTFGTVILRKNNKRCQVCHGQFLAIVGSGGGLFGHSYIESITCGHEK